MPGKRGRPRKEEDVIVSMFNFLYVLVHGATYLVDKNMPRIMEMLGSDDPAQRRAARLYMERHEQAVNEALARGAENVRKRHEKKALDTQSEAGAASDGPVQPGEEQETGTDHE